jgi:subtilisin
MPSQQGGMLLAKARRAVGMRGSAGVPRSAGRTRSAGTALLPALLLVAAAASAAPDAAQVDALAARAAERGSLRAIVELAVPFAPEGLLPARTRLQQRREIGAAQAGVAAVLAGQHARVQRAFQTVPFLALELDAASLRALAASPWVASVHEEHVYRPLLDTTVPAIEGDLMLAVGLDGAGQTVVVLDTGVDGAHPNLAGKLVAEACFASGAAGPSGDCPNGRETQFGAGAGIYCPYSNDCRHGTHVAGIAVGNGPQYSGVARGATLVSVQVASESSNPTECGALATPCPAIAESDLLAALEYVYDTLRFAYTIPVVNMSLGGAPYTSQALCDAQNGALKTVIDNLRAVDIATVIAAGNDGLDDAIDAPACISSAVSVGATADNHGVPSFSNGASFLSLWAPGVGVLAPRYKTTSYVSMSGTSQAAPHVAGAWAMLRAAVPGLGVSEALAALQSTGYPVTHPTATTTFIRIRAAFEALTIACADGIDTDGDGFVDLADPGCSDAQDDDERGTTVCDNGLDDDGDGWADAPDDPGCGNPLNDREDPQCQDGINNDPGEDALVDFDGGASLNGGVPLTAPDPQCVDKPWRASEANRCGLGAELALVAALLPLARRARRRRR